MPVMKVELIFPNTPMFQNMPLTRKHNWQPNFGESPLCLRQRSGNALFCFACLTILLVPLCGCTLLQEYLHNGFKVGPNYRQPTVPVAPDWIDASDKRLRKDGDDLSKWWTVFNDPVLDNLICCAYHQNLTLRQAGCRILEARAQLGIAVGELFPQTQDMTGSYTRNAISREVANSSSTVKPFYSQWNYGFNLNWELDFWGRFRRAIESNSASLEASVADYDETLVTLLGDVANYYAQMRTLEKRIEYTKQNVRLQQQTVTIAEGRFRGGTTTERDPYQARSTLEQTQSPNPGVGDRSPAVVNQLCILLGMPPEDLQAKLGPTPIPTAPAEVVVGIPADLLRRRPEVRRAERRRPPKVPDRHRRGRFLSRHLDQRHLGLPAQYFPNLFRPDAFTGNIGPSFQWNLLNYGRILNNVRFQDARFQELVAAYQQTVLMPPKKWRTGWLRFCGPRNEPVIRTPARRTPRRPCGSFRLSTMAARSI